jgi:hypothetical protein
LLGFEHAPVPTDSDLHDLPLRRGRRARCSGPFDRAVQTLLLQDWLTVQCSVDSVTQSASSWLDVKEFEDLVFFLDVKQQSGPPTVISYQTAPARENAAFVTLLSTSLVAGTTATALLATYASVPVARFLRWQLSADGAFNTTFRVWVAAHSLD